MMRDPIRVWRTGRALHRWLRRAAVTAVPLAGLCGCGNNCHDRVDTQSRFVDGGIAWAPGSRHSAAECFQYCGMSGHDPCGTLEAIGCVVPADAGSIIQCETRITRCYEPCGRMPAGLKWASTAAQPSVVAAQLAAAAHLEGAAVFAFEALERELVAHGAPIHLVARARSAQRDEKRHHSAISGLAIHFGARVPPVEVQPIGIRTLVEVAIENAVEGCVRETYGAAVAALQGECAGNLSLRRAMRSIAVDEAEHALLAWAIDAWARPRLTPGEGAQVEAARGQARAQLIAKVEESTSPELSTILRLPTPAASAHLITTLTALWA
jgi:hypothetical protein